MSNATKWVIGGLAATLLLTIIGFSIALYNMSSNKEPGEPVPSANFEATALAYNAQSAQYVAASGTTIAEQNAIAQNTNNAAATSIALNATVETAKAAGDLQTLAQATVIAQQVEATVVAGQERLEEIAANTTPPPTVVMPSTEAANDDNSSDDAETADEPNYTVRGNITVLVMDGNQEVLDRSKEELPRQFPDYTVTVITAPDCNTVLEIEPNGTDPIEALLFDNEVNDFIGDTTTGIECLGKLTDEWNNVIRIGHDNNSTGNRQYWAEVGAVVYKKHEYEKIANYIRETLNLGG